METDKINLLSQVFTELTDERQSGVLEMSKSLLKAQRYSRALTGDRKKVIPGENQESSARQIFGRPGRS